MSLLAYSPLAGGGLTGKYIQDGGSGAGKGARFNRFPGYMARYNGSPAREATVEYMKVRGQGRGQGSSPGEEQQSG